MKDEHRYSPSTVPSRPSVKALMNLGVDVDGFNMIQNSAAEIAVLRHRSSGRIFSCDRRNCTATHLAEFTANRDCSDQFLSGCWQHSQRRSPNCRELNVLPNI